MSRIGPRSFAGEVFALGTLIFVLFVVLNTLGKTLQTISLLGMSLLVRGLVAAFGSRNVSS